MGMDRRMFLRRAAVAASGLALPSTVWARAFAQDADPVRVYVVVVDGLRPDEVQFMPQVAELAAEGAYWPDGRAEMVAETTPNHVAMLTGMRADRHGMPGNTAPGRAGHTLSLGDEPRYLKADSLFTLLRRQAPDAVTASVTSKTYLVGMSEHDRDGDGEPDAGYVYQPNVFIPESNHEPDYLVMPEAIRVSREDDPDFLFVNLGDVDRVGHADPTGNLPLGVWRTQTLTDTDTWIRALVEDLKSRDVWGQTVFVVTSDHGMDWSTPDAIVNLMPTFDDDDLLAGEVLVGENGGVGLYMLRSPAESRAGERLARMREIALDHDGVRDALYARPNPVDGGTEHWVGRVYPEWGLTSDRSGDLIVTVEPGWRVSEPSPPSNPIPGNHGHPVTLPIPVIVAGGWEGVAAGEFGPALDEGQVDVYPPAAARNIDIAPTVAWLLGLHEPPGGFDGRVLEEAFTMRPPPRAEVNGDVPMPRTRRLAGQTRLETAVALSEAAYPDGADVVVVAFGWGFADALAAVPLAVAEGGPLLLSATEGLDDHTAREVRRLGPTRAVLVGGEAVLSEQVDEDLRAEGVDDVTRLGGANRYDTARLVAEHVGANQGEAVLASGEGFPDALAAGPVAGAAGRPVLLTRPGELPDETLAAIEAAEVTRVLIAGGTAAVSAGVEDALRADGLVVERLGGADRYATAALLAERAIRDGGVSDIAWLVSGADFPDALAAGAAVTALGGLLVLVPPDGLGAAATGELLARRADEYVRLHYVGGQRALPTALTSEVEALIQQRRSR